MGIFSLFGTHQRHTANEYVFMVVLVEDTIHGFAFNKHTDEKRSQLYTTHVDSFLKDLDSKVDELIDNCQKDLGKDVYLTDTIFVLNSFYTSERGSLKEEVRAMINKVCKELDLHNLGYMTTYELIGSVFGEKHDSWIFLEETSHSYHSYTFVKDRMVKEQRFTQTQDREASLQEAREQLGDDPVIVWLHGPVFEEEQLEPITYIDPQALPQYGKEVFDMQNNTESSSDLPEAPGFSDPSLDTVPKPNPMIEKMKHMRLSFPKLTVNPWIVGGGAVALFLILLGSYLFFLYNATIQLVTNKENFSTSIDITVDTNSSLTKTLKGSFSFELSHQATGEKVIGEKAMGEILIYNRTFKQQNLSAGTALTTNDGVSFVLDDDVSIASASGVPVIDGKKTAAVTASVIGSDGNIAKNVKLIVDGVTESDVYAVSNKEFTGGFKKTGIVFSEEDSEALKKKANDKLRTDMQSAFAKVKGSGDMLLPDTADSNASSKTDASIGEEVRTVTMQYEGTYAVYYLPEPILRGFVQKEKLKDKEFVKDTFQLQKLTLDGKKSDVKNKEWVYTAQVSGKIQKFIDQAAIREQLQWRLLGQAQNI
ncbi:hypothetical protein COU89_02050, partial [Candidatus Roizmanbacteria bacterium CG10_big_fil_rev_8_21_14_0_10_45_7]